MHEASRKSTMSRRVKIRITRTGEIGPDSIGRGEVTAGRNWRIDSICRPSLASCRSDGRHQPAHNGSGPF